jgi:hypothetical protein
MNLLYFEFFGERCSGTNFLETAIFSNFHLIYRNEGRNKHFFCFNKYDSSYDNTLFIGIVRNPIYWINSFYVEKHNIPEKNKGSLKAFMFNPFYSVDKAINYSSNINKTKDLAMDFMKQYTLNKEYIIAEDLNYLTKTPYKNIFELRRLKNHYLMNILPNMLKNYIFINYEDLLYNYTETLEKIRIQFHLDKKAPMYKPVKQYKKSNNFTFIKQREILLPPQVTPIIWSHLDIEQERKLGYTPEDIAGSFFRNRANIPRNEGSEEDHFP